MPGRPALWLSLMLAAAMLVSACGAGASTSLNAEGVPVSGGAKFVPAGAVSANNGLPAVDVVDLSDGSTVNLATAAPSEKTLLLWFWAPY